MRLSYSNIKRCIYCGTIEGPLRREHIMPRGLGGNFAPTGYNDALVLRNASCTRCEKVTQKFEQDCLVPMLGQLRARAGLRRKDRQPGAAVAHIKHHDGRTEELSASPEDLPAFLVVPRFRHAAIFDRETTSTNYLAAYEFCAAYGASKEFLAKYHKVGIEAKADAIAFQRMIAKIGLGLAVGAYGPDGFQPLVREMILGDLSQMGAWVGSLAPEEEPPVDHNMDHWCNIRQQEVSGTTYILVHVRLFAWLNSPTSYALVGRL